MGVDRFVHWDNPLFEMEAEASLGSSAATCDNIWVVQQKLNGEIVHKEQSLKRVVEAE